MDTMTGSTTFSIPPITHRFWVLVGVLVSLVASPKNAAHGWSVAIPATSRRQLVGSSSFSSCGMTTSPAILHRTTTKLSMSSSTYGEDYDSSTIVRELASLDELENLVQLASQPIPERPDGIVVCVQYTSNSREECLATSMDYERLARNNLATIFLQCVEGKYEESKLLLEQVDVRVWPTCDIFYGGNRVARVEGNDMLEIERFLNQYQFLNSDLDLFGDSQQSLGWGDGKRKDAKATPRTTARFLPGYDWNTKKGAFDEAADKAQQSFEDSFGNWVPNVEDD